MNRFRLSPLRSLWTALLPLTIVACGPPSDPHVPPGGPAATPSASASASARSADKPSAPRASFVGPSGEVAAMIGARVQITSPSGAEQLIETDDLRPPPGDRAQLGIAPLSLLYLDDGTLLVGLGDGTVTALDGAGHRRYSLGFHGAVTGLVAAGDGLVAVTTERGVLALMSGDGKLRWERQLTAEHLGEVIVAPDHTLLTASQRGVFALSRSGELVFSHASHLLHTPCARYSSTCAEEAPPRLSLAGGELTAGKDLRFRLDGPHPPVPDLAPSFPLTFRKVLDASVVSLLAEGKTGVLALVTRRKARSDYDWATDDKYEVVRIEGGTKLTRFAVPEVTPRSEVFLKDTRAAKAPLFIDSLVAGPNGNPWILARRLNHERTSSGDGILGRFGGAGQVLELAGSKVDERKDLFKPFFEHWLSAPIAAAPEGTANLLCFGLEQPECALYDGSRFRLLTPPGRVAAVQRIGKSTWLLFDDGAVSRLAFDDKGFEAVARPEKASFSRIAGASESDVWGDFEQRYVILHRDGAAWTEVPVPAPVSGLFARASDDVWGGRMRWDGKRWSLVHGAPATSAALLRSNDDVWLGDAAGLWHGTAPGPSPVRLPAIAPSDDGALPAPLPLPAGAADTAHLATPTSIEVANSTPLTSARSVFTSADGVVWLRAWDRLVELDEAGKGTTLSRGAKDSSGRAAYPEARGRGLVLDHNEVQRLDAAAVKAEEVQLDHQDVVAIHGDGRGAMWVVGSPLAASRSAQYSHGGNPFGDDPLHPGGLSAWEEFSAHALVRPASGAAFQPVLGLPSAAWCDVAAAADGGAWFAGGLSHGPAGEGILVHARGKLGSEGTSRFRAAASLLAVTAVGSDEAWAVGAGGTVIHVKGAAVTRYTLASGEWLRAALATSPDDVWIGGDGGTLLHWDGRAFHAVANPLGAHAAFTGIAASRGVVWAVGPSGILRITKRP